MRRKIVLSAFFMLCSLSVQAQSVPQSTTCTSKFDQTNIEPDNDELLIKAIESGELGEVIRLLEAGADPNATRDDASALIVAVGLNRADIAEVLLERGAKVDLEAEDDRSALQTAAASGRANLVKLLIAHGADVNHMDHDGHPPLWLAVMGSMIRNTPAWLLRSYFEMDDDDKTMKGMGNEHLESARLLIQAGAKVNGPATEDGTVLMSAAMFGNVEMTRLLLENHADPNESNGDDGDGNTALKLAEEYDSPEELAEQLGHQDSVEKKQALLDWVHFSAAGRKAVAAMLRKAGATH